MPTIPAPTTQSVFASPNNATLNINAQPSAFGAQAAVAGERLGGAIGQAGDVAAQHAIRFQEIQNETNTDATMTSYQDRVRQILFDPKSGFYTKQGKDAVDAMDPTATKIEEVRQSIRQDLPNPQQQRMFDMMSRKATDRELYSMSSHAAQQNNAWRKETSVGAIQSSINDSAMYWNDSTRFAQSLGEIKIQAERLATMQGLDPASDAGKMIVQHYTSEAWQARIHSVMAQDPNIARQLFDVNADMIDAPHRATLDAQITNHQYTFMARAVMKAQHDEATAARHLREAQTINEANYLADTASGNPPSPAVLADALRTLKISPEGYFAVLRGKNERGSNDPETELTSWQRVGDDKITGSDIMGMVKLGLLKGETGAQMTRALSELHKQENNEERTGYLQALRSALGGHALQMGMLDFSKQAYKDQAALISRAEAEYTLRTVLKKEQPAAVYSDMIARYQPHTFGTGGLPRPRFATGPVTDIEQIKSLKQQVDDGLARGTLTKEQANHEYDLQGQYIILLKDQQARKKQAEERAKTMNQGGPKAKFLGTQPAPADTQLGPMSP